MRKPGEIAPDFPVAGTTLHAMLAERGVVVFFFPKAFTPGCSREARGFARDHETFRQAGYGIVGVSADPQEVSDRFRQSLELPYPLVGDPRGEILRAYKVRWPVIGLAQRVTYVVGRDRRIASAFHSEFDAEAHVGRTCAVARGGPQ